jgi:hypothetical protein
MAATVSTILIGGDFATIGGQPRAHLAALDPSADQFLDWSPEVNGTCVPGRLGQYDVCRGELYVHWRAKPELPGCHRHGYPPGNRLEPGSNGAVGTLAVAGSTVYAGGAFTSMAGKAGITLPPLMPSPAGPLPGTRSIRVFNHNYVDPSEQIGALAVSGNTVYVAGAYTAIGRANRSAWRPQCGQREGYRLESANNDRYYYVSTLVVQDGVLYAGGRFTAVGNKPIANFAASGN